MFVKLEIWNDSELNLFKTKFNIFLGYFCNSRSVFTETKREVHGILCQIMPCNMRTMTQTSIANSVSLRFRLFTIALTHYSRYFSARTIRTERSKTERRWANDGQYEKYTKKQQGVFVCMCVSHHFHLNRQLINIEKNIKKNKKRRSCAVCDVRLLRRFHSNRHHIFFCS